MLTFGFFASCFLLTAVRLALFAFPAVANGSDVEGAADAFATGPMLLDDVAVVVVADAAGCAVAVVVAGLAAVAAGVGLDAVAEGVLGAGAETTAGADAGTDAGAGAVELPDDVVVELAGVDAVVDAFADAVFGGALALVEVEAVNEFDAADEDPLADALDEAAGADVAGTDVSALDVVGGDVAEVDVVVGAGLADEGGAAVTGAGVEAAGGADDVTCAG